MRLQQLFISDGAGGMATAQVINGGWAPRDRRFANAIVSSAASDEQKESCASLRGCFRSGESVLPGSGL